MRTYDHDGSVRRRRRFDDDEPPANLKRRRTAPPTDAVEPIDGPPVGDRWSTWPDTGTIHGPRPRPDWIITESGAVDTDLGLLKTGKEADVHLLRRGIPDGGREVLLAAKRYRSAEHRLFHRDAGYLEGRRVRQSRTTRAMARRTTFGREAIAGQWAAAEFDALSRLWEIGREHGGIQVPYPVQLIGTELLMEFIGSPDGAAAPRLAQLRPEPDRLADLWRQVEAALTTLARAGLAHGDLSPFNVLVSEDRLVLIDLPQIVDVVINPGGQAFLTRDVTVMADWFTARGLPIDPVPLVDDLLADAHLR